MRPNATYLLVKLASADENAIPSPLFVDKAVVVSPKKEPFRGGFAAVREGRLHGDTVAIKELYPRGLSGAKLRKVRYDINEGGICSQRCSTATVPGRPGMAACQSSQHP